MGVGRWSVNAGLACVMAIPGNSRWRIEQNQLRLVVAKPFPREWGVHLTQCWIN